MARLEVCPQEFEQAAGALRSVGIEAGSDAQPSGTLGAGEFEEALGSLASRAQRLSIELSNAAAQSSRNLDDAASCYVWTDTGAMPDANG